jgi:hypothetical protein
VNSTKVRKGRHLHQLPLADELDHGRQDATLVFEPLKHLASQIQSACYFNSSACLCPLTGPNVYSAASDVHNVSFVEHRRQLSATIVVFNYDTTTNPLLRTGDKTDFNYYYIPIWCNRNELLPIRILRPPTCSSHPSNATNA